MSHDGVDRRRADESSGLAGDGIGLIAAAFVIFWSTGYVVAKLSLPDAGPGWFLTWRFGLACAGLIAIAAVFRLPWPRRPRDYRNALLVGVLVHCLGLGGVWVGLERGVEAGVAALIMGTQPLLTAVAAATLLRERLAVRVVLGLVVGFAGVALVILDKLGAGIGSAAGLAVVCLAVVSLTAGTLFQARACAHLDLATGNAVQLLGATVLAGLLALTMEDRGMTFSRAVVFSLAWSVLVLSIGTMALFYWLLRRGAAARVSSLLYLVPPVTAIIAWADFGEALGATVIAGIVLTSVGVALVIGGGGRKPRFRWGPRRDA